MSQLALFGGTPLRSSPFPSWPVWDNEDEQAMLRVMRSAHWGISAQEDAPTRQFEQAFAQSHQAKYCQTVFNGTVALQTSLMALGIEYGDEVIVPPYTFLATASACLLVGAIPVFVDIDPGSYNLNPALIEAAITPRTRAIIAVHIGGCPADLDAILAVAKRRNLPVIEDACQAHGGEWKGRRVGAIADLGCFSFQSSKNLTSGEGGAIITDNEALYNRCWSIQNCGRSREGAWYQHNNLGGNYRMTQWQGGLLLSQLRRFEEHAALREANGNYLADRTAEIGGFEPQARDPRITRHGYHLFISRYDPDRFHGLKRETFLKALEAEGIPCSSGYTPLYRMPAIQDGIRRLGRFTGYARSQTPEDFPVNERACASEGVWFTQNMLLGTRKDMDDIADAVLKVRENAALLVKAS